MLVDYAGQTIPMHDADTGQIMPAELFVATLGASNYTYAEATGYRCLKRTRPSSAT